MSRNAGWLYEVAKKLKVLPMYDLISLSPGEALGLADNEDLLVAFDMPEKWFTAEEGLKTITALLQHTESAKPGETGLIADLRSCQQVLERAKEQNVRFRFSVDF